MANQLRLLKVNSSAWAASVQEIPVNVEDPLRLTLPSNGHVPFAIPERLNYLESVQTEGKSDRYSIHLFRNNYEFH